MQFVDAQDSQITHFQNYAQTTINEQESLTLFIVERIFIGYQEDALIAMNTTSDFRNVKNILADICPFLNARHGPVTLSWYTTKSPRLSHFSQSKTAFFA